MMTYVYCYISNRRREMIIQPDKNDEFRTLCSSDHPVTVNLFGDDLGKKVEDIFYQSQQNRLLTFGEQRIQK